MATRRVAIAPKAACAAAALWLALAGTGWAQGRPVNLRGDVSAVSGNKVTLAERSGKQYTLVLGPKSRVGTLMAAKLSDVKAGGYIGTSAVPRADGKLVAQEIHILPKGVGEGHRKWDLTPNSTMTNADVTAVVAAAAGEQITLKYRGGEKTLVVPPGTPVVRAGKPDRAAVKPGAHVFALAAPEPDGSYNVIRMSVGLNGLVPPM